MFTKNYLSELLAQFFLLCNTETRGRSRASANTKDTEECLMAWTGAGCDLYGKDPFWVSSCLCGKSTHRGILASVPKTQSFFRKGQSMQCFFKISCDSGNNICKLGTFFNKMLFIRKIRLP